MAVVSETQFVTPLMPCAGEGAQIFRDAESLVAAGASMVESGVTGQNKSPGEDRQQMGMARFLGPWDRIHPDFQDMLGAVLQGDQIKLKPP